MNARRAIVALVMLLAMLAPVRLCAAHPGYPASALVHIERDGTITLHVRHDSLAFALNETPVMIGDPPMRELLKDPDELRAALERGRHRFLNLFHLTANDAAVEVELTEGPDADAILAEDTPEKPARLPIMLEFVAVAKLPLGTTHFTLQFPEVMGDVITTIERPGAEPFSLPLRAGERSPEIEMQKIELAQSAASAEPPPAAPMGAPEVAWRYVVLGTEHIIPYGLDHILFVLGLFFLSTRLKPLLWQITTFTLAHSVTLTLATLNWVQLPASIVEPMIAASITFVAIENLMTTKLHVWRPLVVFGFGLVHGLGFASVLKDVGLPGGQLAIALVSFNVGVEVGQLSVIVTAMLLLDAFRSKKWYRPRIAVPASIVIAASGLYWTIQRTIGF